MALTGGYICYIWSMEESKRRTRSSNIARIVTIFPNNQKRNTKTEKRNTKYEMPCDIINDNDDKGKD